LWRAINGLALKIKEAATDAGIDARTLELLNVRMSQMNGCAYCLDLHVKEALKAGETTQRLAVLPAWRDTALFTEKERAALALVESITELPGQSVREQEEGSVVSWAAASMNAFNRISITSHHPVRRNR
jgi:AhpD family alkylhydroperoxidase